MHLLPKIPRVIRYGLALREGVETGPLHLHTANEPTSVRKHGRRNGIAAQHISTKERFLVRARSKESDCTHTTPNLQCAQG